MAAMRRRKESQRSGAGAGIQEPWRLERQMKWIDDFAHLRQLVIPCFFFIHRLEKRLMYRQLCGPR